MRPGNFKATNLVFYAIMGADLHDLPVVYSLETGVVSWDEGRERHTVSLRHDLELSLLWEPMTPEKFNYLMAILYSVPDYEGFTDHDLHALSISPEGHVIKASPGLVEETTLARFPSSVGSSDARGRWKIIWDREDDDKNYTGEEPDRVTRIGTARGADDQPSLAEFSHQVHTLHKPSGTTDEYTDNSHAIAQAANFLRTKMGVDKPPAEWTQKQWSSANCARLHSIRHAETTDFSEEKAARAVQALVAAVETQRTKRRTFRKKTAAGMTQGPLPPGLPGGQQPGSQPPSRPSGFTSA